jgi:hypothetical protein
MATKEIKEIVRTCRNNAWRNKTEQKTKITSVRVGIVGSVLQESAGQFM